MKLKRLGAALLCLFAVFLLPLQAHAVVPEPAEGFYVTDLAGVINPEDSAVMLEYGARLEAEHNGAQVVLVCVDFTDGRPIDEYARELFNQWGIGAEEHNNGLLILLAIGEDNYWVMQGAGLETTLPSGKIAQINAEYLEDDFAAGNYSAGALKVYGAFVQALGGAWPGGEPAQSIEERSTGGSGYFYDEAGVTTAQERGAYNSLIASRKNETGTALYVAIISTTGERGMYDYTNDMFSAFNMDETDVALLLAIDDDDYMAIQGADISPFLRDNELDDILADHLENYFVQRNYAAGATEVAQAIYHTLGNASTVPQQHSNVYYAGLDLMGLALWLIIGILFIVILIERTYRRRSRYHGDPYQPYYRPRIFWWFGPRWGRRHYGPPPPGGPGAPPPPAAGGSSRGSGSGRKPPGGGFFGGGSSGGGGGFFGSGGSPLGGGGFSRGGGAGRSSSGSSSSSGRSSSSSGRSSSGGGGRSGGGGSSRGGGAGRR